MTTPGEAAATALWTLLWIGAAIYAIVAIERAQERSSAPLHIPFVTPAWDWMRERIRAVIERPPRTHRGDPEPLRTELASFLAGTRSPLPTHRR